MGVASLSGMVFGDLRSEIPLSGSGIFAVMGHRGAYSTLNDPLRGCVILDIFLDSSAAMSKKMTGMDQNAGFRLEGR